MVQRVNIFKTEISIEFCCKGLIKAIDEVMLKKIGFIKKPCYE